MNSSVRLWTLLLVGAALVASAQAPSSNPTQDAEKLPPQADHTRQSDVGQPKAVPPAGTVLPAAATESHTEQKQPDPKNCLDYICDVLGRASTTNWLIVFLTLAYVIASNGQLDAMRRQAESAARLERPWLVIKGEGPPVFHPHPSESDPRQFWAYVPWSITNVGKSPAWMYRMTFNVVPASNPPPLEPPPFDEDDPIADFPLPPGAAHGAHPPERWTVEEKESIGPGFKCVMVYGIVRYRDAAREEYFTRFCFLWDLTIPTMGQWEYEPIGPAAYIEYK
jgi:hypothetical protein